MFGRFNYANIAGAIFTGCLTIAALVASVSSHGEHKTTTSVKVINVVTTQTG